MTDQNLRPGDSQHVNSRGRARGLIAVWEEMQQMRNRIWLHACPTPGHGRVATVALLSEMVTQNTIRAPGPRSHLMGRGLAGITSNANDPSPSRDRARNRNPGHHPHVEAPLCLPYSWPQCLCWCRCPADIPPSPSSEMVHDNQTSWHWYITLTMLVLHY